MYHGAKFPVKAPAASFKFIFRVKTYKYYINLPVQSDNSNTRKRCETCLNLTIKSLYRL